MLPHKHLGISQRHKMHSLKPKAKAKGKGGGQAKAKSKATPVKKDKHKAASPKQTPPKTDAGGKKATASKLTDAQRARKNAHSAFWHSARLAAKNAGKTPEEAKAHPVMTM